MIKYHNAKDADGNIVSIDKAVKGKHYSCISCGKDMIPKQGKIREHHFSHKKERENSPENICNEETYLHEYAKHYIKRLFDTSTELMIVYNQYNVCHHFTSCLYYRKVLDNSSDEYSSSLCKGTTLGKFDLKRYYDTCELEKEYKGYVADVLLTSKEHHERDPLFVEIAVSHS